MRHDCVQEANDSMEKAEKSKSIYICHTFYHVYVAALKELERIRQGQGGERADLMLSAMSTDFGDLEKRVRESGIFRDVIRFGEKDWTFFPELVPLKKDTGSLVRNMLQRVRFCRRLGDLEADYVPVDLKAYRDIYVFCDSDPIGYYLSRRKIYYHALEDGLNCLRYRDTAVEDNRGHFAFKAWMAKRGLIFIQNGYGKYCLDMEVNDLSALDHPIPNMKECSREELVSHLTPEDREKLCSMFIANRKELDDTLREAKNAGMPLVLILTEPLCQDLSVRERLFRDMIAEYGTIGDRKARIVIKPHPRDLLDYHRIFPEHVILDSRFPMEILNFTGAEFDRVVTVYTVPSGIHCARQKIYLGNEYMDRYEDPALHAKVKNSVKSVTGG